MKKYRWIIILLNLILLLISINSSIVEKETLLDEGELILLKLRPVDPRSLMQGDYMNLRYEIADDINLDSIPKRGFCILYVNSLGVAENMKIKNNTQTLDDNQYMIAYTARKWRGVNIGAESFFFQEGQADKFGNAEYGGIKVDESGNSLLIGLYDEKLNKIE